MSAASAQDAGEREDGEPSARGTDNVCDGDAPNAFDDDDDNFFHDLINCMASYDITEGYDDDTYRTGRDVLRAEMASFVARFIEDATEEEIPEGDDAFEDDSSGASATHESNINKLANIEVVEGTDDGDFDGADDVTRAQMAQFIRRAVDYIDDGDAMNGSEPPATDEDFFPDDTGNFSEENIDRLASVGIVEGREVAGETENLYRTADSVQRSNMAAFIMRAYDYVESDEFDDEEAQPEARTIFADLGELNDSGGDGFAELTVNEDGSLDVSIEVSGLEDEVHAQHIHGFEPEGDAEPTVSSCPTPDDADDMEGSPEGAANPDELISTPEGLEDYGNILLPLDGTDDAAADAASFPEGGDYEYSMSFDSDEALDAVGDLDDLENRAIVVHGKTIEDDEGGQTYNGLLPVLCGPVVEDDPRDLTVTPEDDATLGADETREYTASGLDTDEDYRVTLVESDTITEDDDGNLVFTEDVDSPSLAVAGDVDSDIIEVNGEATDDPEETQSVGAIAPSGDGDIVFTVETEDTDEEFEPVVYTDEADDGGETRLNLDEDGEPDEPFGVGGAISVELGVPGDINVDEVGDLDGEADGEDVDFSWTAPDDAQGTIASYDVGIGTDDSADGEDACTNVTGLTADDGVDGVEDDDSPEGTPYNTGDTDTELRVFDFTEGGEYCAHVRTVYEDDEVSEYNEFVQFTIGEDDAPDPDPEPDPNGLFEAGEFTMTVESGSVEIGTNEEEPYTIDFTECPDGEPAEGEQCITFDGTIDADGNFTIPSDGVFFPETTVSDPLTIAIATSASDDVTGSIDPETGAASFDLPLQVDLDINDNDSDDCRITLGIDGTTGESGAVSGSPLTDDGLNVVGGEFAVPETTPLDGPEAALCPTVDSVVGLPSPSGENTAVFDLLFVQ